MTTSSAIFRCNNCKLTKTWACRSEVPGICYRCWKGGYAEEIHDESTYRGLRSVMAH